MDRMGAEMLRGFVGAVHRDAPRKMDWRRFHDFVIYAHARGRRDALLPDQVRAVLREQGLTDREATPFVDFYTQALDLLTYYDLQAG
jgi:hypothetical protein